MGLDPALPFMRNLDEVAHMDIPSAWAKAGARWRRAELKPGETNKTNKKEKREHRLDPPKILLVGWFEITRSPFVLGQETAEFFDRGACRYASELLRWGMQLKEDQLCITCGGIGGISGNFKEK
ncbi:predicted protein [Histoplasma capsulatum G186AR]|uniref:Uncharacterized protein n=1 Tax=Ajellomyces capsulatus (strain G186AR / H82 / ATCC MYA-2454 / RMSCC 2432) TaxID=447093 RepID=C0NV52_AJECG|nr:uncharacterized protein HCBG_06816 [Histoplasma capsulatum G186AR]EEH04865.1 predicted protein [Histoplasma capsulatum G186AR]